MSSMPQMEGRAGQHLSWSSLALKALVVLLVPLVVFRFLFVDVWGGLNDAAVPILGLYLLRGEDESFFACYERLSKIWLFNECCGIQKDVTFVSALIVFILISLVCGANDAYLLFCQDPSISRWHSLVAGNGLLNLTCAALAVHMWRASFQAIPVPTPEAVEERPQPLRPIRRSSRIHETKAEADPKPSQPEQAAKRQERGQAKSAILRHLTVPMSEEEARRSRESSAERDPDRLAVPLRQSRRSSSWKLGSLFKPTPDHHRSSSQPPVVHPWLGEI
ncbi:unnamed protein product [Symbiodinium natans]|uniref:Transmembrane protein n=1 Tax=Symbiodinium natans TaxID=878477 RepID=A0A812N450_9DINO|nr:unnamed protein product [Symbiodinium natans]